MGVPNADLHGQHLRRRVVLQEVGQVSQRGHQEARLVTMELQPQEAVALGQLGMSGSAGPALQERAHLGAVGALGQVGAGLAACEKPRQRLELALASVLYLWRACGGASAGNAPKSLKNNSSFIILNLTVTSSFSL